MLSISLNHSRMSDLFRARIQCPFHITTMQNLVRDTSHEWFTNLAKADLRDYNRAMLGVFLPAVMERRFLFFARHVAGTCCCRNATEFEHLLHNRPIRVAVVNPVSDGASSTNHIADLIAGYPSIRFVGYFALEPQAFDSVVKVCHAGLQNSLLFGYEYGAEEISRLLSAKPIPILLSLFRVLRPREHALPDVVRPLLVRILKDPESITSVESVARQYELSLSRTYRSFKTAGLPSPSALLMCAKLLCAYTYIKDPRSSVSGVARKVGYQDVRTLRSHSEQVFGLPPSFLAGMTEERAIDCVRGHILT